MQKEAKKLIAKILLYVFIFNLVSTHRNKLKATPTAIAAPLAAQILVNTCFAIYGIVAAYLSSKNTGLPHKVVKSLQEHTSQTICDEPMQIVAPSVTSEIVEEVAKNIKHSNVLVFPEAVQIESAKAYIDSLCKVTSCSITKKTLDKLIVKPCMSQPAISSNPALVEPKFDCMSIPYGIQFQSSDGKICIPIQFSTKSIQDAEHVATLQALKNIGKLRYLMSHRPVYRNMIINEVRNAVNILAKTQIGELNERIEACLLMDKLYVESLVFKEFALAVEKLKAIYFHDNNTLCFEAFHRNTEASLIIKNFVEETDQQLGFSINRYELIDPIQYQELKRLALRYGSYSGNKCYCSRTKTNCSACTGKDMQSLIEACRKFDFKQAQAIEKKYPGNVYLRRMIDDYTSRQETMINAKRAVYNEYGIVRVAQSDPVYLANKNILDHVLSAEKEIINQNFLIRHHLKEKMHERWNIPTTASHVIHDAMYQIIGKDSSALSDISLLQNKIEQIMKSASKPDYDTLLHAFYEPNGVLKEYVLHLPEAKTIALPQKILAPIYEAERQQLNNLLCRQIKYPEQKEEIQQAVYRLAHWLNGSNTKDQIAAKAEFKRLYESIMLQEEKVKISTNQQAQDIVDINSSDPMPPDPEFETEKNDADKPIEKSGSLTEYKYDNRATENDLRHIFDNPTHDHHLDGLLKKFGNNKIKAFRSIYDLTYKQLVKKGLKGKYKIVVNIHAQPVTVKGIILPDGIIKIGTAFIP